jgi:hypothetical protein
VISQPFEWARTTVVDTTIDTASVGISQASALVRAVDGKKPCVAAFIGDAAGVQRN